MQHILIAELAITLGLITHTILEIYFERKNKQMDMITAFNCKLEEDDQQPVVEPQEKPQRETPAFFAFLLDERGSFDSVATAKTQKEMEDLLSNHPHKRPVAVVRGHNMQIGVKLLK